MKSRHVEPIHIERIVFVLLIIACALTRFVDLGTKPIMHDESLFAYYSEFHLHRTWTYEYAPILHGPAMLWFQALVFHVFGVSDYTMRLGAALLGFGAFFWIASMRRWLGRIGTPVALAFYVVSPSLLFYQRFFRNDALFVFTTLWIVASAAHWWQTRKPTWGASFILGCTILFCNKESSLFVYFALATYFLLLLIHDLASDFIEERHTPPSRHPSPPRTWMVAGGLFLFVVLFLTRVLEGIRYDRDVVAAIGRDFVLSDVRSIPLALGWIGPIEGVGIFGTTVFWRVFYLLLPFVCLAAAWMLCTIIRKNWGAGRFLSSAWNRIISARYAVVAAMAVSVLVYLALFTTFFIYPQGPFEIYHETLAYWMGQNAQHRIRGPFHMHMVNMLVYELPAVIAVLAGTLIISFRLRWTRVHAVSILLIAFAFTLFHLLFFRALYPSMPYFGRLAVYTALVGLAIGAAPAIGRWLFPLSSGLFIIYSIRFFNGVSWRAFLLNRVTRGDEIIADSGFVFLDDRLSLTSGVHFFLIASLIITATVLAWNEIRHHRRFNGLLIWWLVIMTGASSYAREKVPWVGIHIAVPIILLTGVIVQAAYTRIVAGEKRKLLISVGACVLAVFVIWNLKASVAVAFVHPGDVRERLAYGETPVEVKAHAKMITDYVRIADLATSNSLLSQGMYEGVDIRGEQWLINYNAPASLKKVRVAVLHPEIVWPMRWYLRDVIWTENVTVKEAIDEEYPFIFLETEEADSLEILREEYHLYHGRGRMHWTPSPLDWSALADIWKVIIPVHRRNEELQTDIGMAKREWNQIWDYLIHRRIPEEPDMGLSVVYYVFAVRKDLPPF